MVYRKPRYFVGQQDPVLPSKRRDPSSTDYDRPSISPYDRQSSKEWFEVKEKGKPLMPSPSPVNYVTSPARLVNRTKPIWVDSKTGKVVDGPDMLKGEKIIRFESSSSDSSSNTEDVSPQIVLKSSRSPSKSRSLSPRHRMPSLIRQQPVTRSTARIRSPHHFVHLSHISPASTSSSTYFQSDSEVDLYSTSSASSGYSSSGYFHRRRPGAKRQSLRPSKIITLNPTDEQSPLRNLVPHQHSCGRRQTTCPHKRCRQMCGYCNANESRQLVSRRSRAIAEKPPEKFNSNLSFFEETILPGPNMPKKHFTPLRYDEFDLYSDSADSYYVYSRNPRGNRSPVRGPVIGRLNDNLEKWLNDAMKSTYSPNYLSKYRPYRNN